MAIEVLYLMGALPLPELLKVFHQATMNLWELKETLQWGDDEEDLALPGAINKETVCMLHLPLVVAARNALGRNVADLLVRLLSRVSEYAVDAQCCDKMVGAITLLLQHVSDFADRVGWEWDQSGRADDIFTAARRALQQLLGEDDAYDRIELALAEWAERED